ncbi:hypothetical protein BH10BAC5_BH10BAC5_27150 [soil metagenome]
MSDTLNKSMNKIPALTLAFWIMKICATTLGETAGDLLSMTLKVGYTLASVILLSFFIVTLIIQLISKTYHPVIYWLVIVSTSTAGTTISDYMDRTLGLGYETGTLILVSLLIIILTIWKLSEKTISVTNIKNFRSEMFYWIAILFSNTLGTALGDFLADSSGLGFIGGAILVGSLILALILAYYYTKISRIVLFWIAFVLTRPFGATFGDLLTKPVDAGGLNFGTIGSSAILAGILIVLIVNEMSKHRKNSKKILVTDTVEFKDF